MARGDGTGSAGLGIGGKSSRQLNTPKGGENFKLARAGSGDGGRAKGEPSKAIGISRGTPPGPPNGGPRNVSTITSFSGPRLGPAKHMGPNGAPYINANSYGAPSGSANKPPADPTTIKGR